MNEKSYKSLKAVLRIIVLPIWFPIALVIWFPIFTIIHFLMSDSYSNFKECMGDLWDGTILRTRD